MPIPPGAAPRVIPAASTLSIVAPPASSAAPVEQREDVVQLERHAARQIAV